MIVACVRPFAEATDVDLLEAKTARGVGVKRIRRQLSGAQSLADGAYANFGRAQLLQQRGRICCGLLRLGRRCKYLRLSGGAAGLYINLMMFVCIYRRVLKTAS